MDIQIRKATVKDAEYLAPRLRGSDKKEVMAMGLSPCDALNLSFVGSDECFAGVVNGEVAMLFGTAQGLYDETASIWALGSEVCNECPVSMVKFGRRMVQLFLEKYDMLENYCDAEYESSLRWLKLIGFTVCPPESKGVHGEKFCRIYVKKEA